MYTVSRDLFNDHTGQFVTGSSTLSRQRMTGDQDYEKPLKSAPVDPVLISTVTFPGCYISVEYPLQGLVCFHE